MGNSRINPPWSHLPPELLSTIANFLNPNPNPLDIVAFRSVCKSWRSSSSSSSSSSPPNSHPSILSQFLPISTIVPPSSIYDRPYSIGHSSPSSLLSLTIVYSLRPNDIPPTLSPNCFVLFVDEFDSGTLKIRQPFSTWSYSLPVFLPAKVNLFDFRAREIGRYCNLSYSCRYNDVFAVGATISRFRSEAVLKVVLLCDGSAAVALFDGGKLGLIRLDLGITDSHWDVLHDGKGFRFDDIVEFKGRVLGVDRSGRVYEIGRSSSEINVIFRSTSIARGSGRRKRLVVSLGVLYLVARCKVGDGPKDGNVLFKVYELNVERNKWVEVSSIGDCVFFFGHDFSFSASAEEISCGKNCILYRKHSFKHYRYNIINEKEVFCRLGSDGVEVGVCHLGAAAHVGESELNSGYLDKFWPPPAWFWPVDRSARFGTVCDAIDSTCTNLFEKFKIKYPELMVEGADLSCDDFQQLGGPVADIIKRDKEVNVLYQLLPVKKLITEMRNGEQQIANCEKILHDALPTNELSVSKATPNQLAGSVVQARTAMANERHNALDDIRSATKQSTDLGFLWNKMSSLLANNNARIFRIEESASKLVRHYFV